MLNDFAGYLSKKIGLKEKYVPHYVRLVGSCYKFFRHSFATHPPKSGTGIMTIQALLDDNDVSTTIIYTPCPPTQGGLQGGAPCQDNFLLSLRCIETSS